MQGMAAQARDGARRDDLIAIAALAISAWPWRNPAEGPASDDAVA
jgi:hypothetical protein